MNTVQVTRDEKQAAILEAATTLFHQIGYAEATIQQIADHLGVQKGSLYHYISSKEDLLFRLLEGVHEDVERIREAVATADELDPVWRLALYVELQIVYNLSHLSLVSIYHHDKGELGEERYVAVLAEERLQHAFVAGLIAEAQEVGAIPDAPPPHLLANCVFATIVWTYSWYMEDGEDSVDAAVALCTTFVMRGIGLSDW